MTTGDKLTPENMVKVMLGSEANWEVICNLQDVHNNNDIKIQRGKGAGASTIGTVIS